jgi:hypothetical protein
MTRYAQFTDLNAAPLTETDQRRGLGRSPASADATAHVRRPTLRAQPLHPSGVPSDPHPRLGGTMRVVIAGFAFDLNQDEVRKLMDGVEPERDTGDVVAIGGHAYPVKQVGELLTNQDRRDFSAREVTRALVRLGFVVQTAQ